MREIKFRVYSDKHHGVFFPGAFSVNQQTHQVGFSGYELMQYTGLRDKNGVEIYEGDLLRWGLLEAAYPVTWKDGQFLSSDIVPLHIGVKNAEVIGTVYENPELLAPHQLPEEPKHEQ